MLGLKTFGSDLLAMSGRLWRSPPPIGDVAGLADFIDEQSAFIAQKGVYEYCRARSGHYAKVLFAEQQFVDAVDRARWLAYPIGLAMVGELVEGVLRPVAGTEQGRQLDALGRVVLGVFDRYSTPAAVGQNAWDETRGELQQRLQRIGLHPVKRAFEVPDPYARAYFDLMPIHKKLRASELPALQGYLRTTSCNVHEELVRRADLAAVSGSLLGGETGI